MAKRRVKRPVKHSASSPSSNQNGAGMEKFPNEKKEDAFKDNEVEHRSAAIRAIRDVQINQLVTELHLLRSYFNEEQLQTPLLQFFKENLPNLSVVTNGKVGQCDLQWKEKDGILSMNQAGGKCMHASLLHQTSIAYPDCSLPLPSFGGFELSSKAVEENLLGANNLQIGDFVLEEPSNTQILGSVDALQTPGATSQRWSVGLTPKSRRLPKHGEMLLSIHGSPLGVYKEDNMEAIHESAEDRAATS